VTLLSDAYPPLGSGSEPRYQDETHRTRHPEAVAVESGGYPNCCLVATIGPASLNWNRKIKLICLRNKPSLTDENVFHTDFVEKTKDLERIESPYLALVFILQNPSTNSLFNPSGASGLLPPGFSSMEAPTTARYLALKAWKKCIWIPDKPQSFSHLRLAFELTS